ncbi:GRIP protein [Phytophthora cactorum]|nr:GRIP protein [Phytophthora cactorum]
MAFASTVAPSSASASNRAALEEAIESCSATVRVLQEKMRNKDEAVAMDDITKEVKKLVGLAQKEEDVENNQDEEETPETEDVEEELEERTVELESRVAETDDKLTTLETAVTQIERTKKAMKYLEEHETKETVLETVETEVVVKKSSKKNKKKNKKAKEEVEEESKPAVSEEKVGTEQVAELTTQLEAERVKVQEASQKAEKLQKSVETLTEEKSAAVAKLTAELEEERSKAEQTSQKSQEMHKLEQDEKDEAVAKLTAELEKERSKVEQASQTSQEKESKLEKSFTVEKTELVSKLQAAEDAAKAARDELESKIQATEDAAKTSRDELEAKLQAAEDTAKSTRDELEKLQAELSEIKGEKETRETHLGKLWKNIEDLQLANKELMEKNASIEADAKAMRAEAEKTIADHSSYEDKTESFTAEIESTKAELEASKTAAKNLQAEVEKLTSQVSGSKSEMSSSEKRIQTLEKELEAAKKHTENVSTELESLRGSSTDSESTIASSNERIEALEKELEAAKQSVQEVLTERDALKTSNEESERTHKEEIEKLTSQISELESTTEGKSGELAEELKKAQEAAKAAIADKEEIGRQLIEMKDNVIQMKLESEKALSQASQNGSHLKKLLVDLEARTAEAKQMKALYDDLVSQRTNAEGQLRICELLKKARASLLEANEELKEARANSLKWKNSAQAAKTLMNAKIADAESASKQLKKARAMRRRPVLLEKKVAKTKQELATVRAELAKALETIETERTQSKQTHATQVAKLREVSEQTCKMMSEETEAASALAASGGTTLSGAFPRLRRRSFLFLLMRRKPEFPPFSSRPDAQRLETDKRELIEKLKKAHQEDKSKLKRQLEDKDGELMLATSKVEAFQVELQAQQEDNKELQKTAAQEEARVMVFQEEKNRLTDQVAAMLEDKQQRERETQQLVDENHTLQSKVEDLIQQVQGAREQREDVEQLYLEVASKLNQALRDNDELTKTNVSGDRITELETQLKALERNADQYEQDKLQLTQQIEALTASNDRVTAELSAVADIREKLLVHAGIDLTYESIESLLDTKNKEIQMLTEQLSAADAPQEQAALQTQCDSLASDKTEQDKTVEELRLELERVAEEHSASLEKQRRAYEEKQNLMLRAHGWRTGGVLEHIEKQLVGAGKPDMNHLESEAKALQERIHKYETENQLLTAKLEECETALKARAREIESLSASSGENAACNGDTPENCNGDACDLELEATRAQLHAVEAEMAACKAENLRMIFEVAKTADGVSKLKKDHEELLETHSKKTSDLDTALVQLKSLESANKTLESDFKRKVRRAACCIQYRKENHKIKRDLEDIKTENDVLESGSPDETQEKDREVEELRSSLVQAKVNFLEQKQQLTALEKKLVEVSKSSGPACTVNNAALDAERREFEAALIEMIEMEKKLQVAYEAKQGLESTLQERMEAKADLEGRLSIAEDKIAELEQQLEQKVALIATIEEQLRSVEEEREKLADEFAKTKSKLERSRGKLEEKAIEFEAFKTTTSMLKDERSRLFNEIALLKEKIAKSEVQKAQMADSQELANEELEEQLNELADKIAEIEARETGPSCEARGDGEEKSVLDDENLKLERTIAHLESKLDSLEGQKTELEAANESSSQQLSLLEEKMDSATTEIATLSAEKNSLTDLQQSLEENVSRLEDDKVKLEQTLEETTSKLRDELEQVTDQVNSLQTQLEESAAEKDEVTASLSELQERVQADKLASEEVAAKNWSLKLAVTKLSEAESRAAVLVEERDAVKMLLQEKQSAYEKLTTQRDTLQRQVEKLTSELRNTQEKHAEEAGAAEETIRALKDVETRLTESLESAKRDLAEAESCVMVLVEERDAARKDLTAKDLKIEVMTSQQGELELTAQKLESELNTLRSKSSATQKPLKKCFVTSTIPRPKQRNSQASLQTIQEQLEESELRVAALEKERDATRTSLNEQESTHETLSALQEDLQKKIDVLETELKELREASSAELAAAHETITSLKATEAEEAETLASLRQELAEAEGCVMVLVEERDAAKKTLSKRELTLEVLSSEHGELQLKSQSAATELEALRIKSAADAQAAEETVQALKEDVKRVTETLEAAENELSSSEARVSSLTAESDTLTKTLSDLETEHEALSAQKEELGERIESLEAEMNSLITQHSSELKAAEETIRTLKSSEAEVKESLEAVRQELSETKTRAESLTEELERIQSLEGELQTLQSQREAETETAEETIRSLKASESETMETLEAIRVKLSKTEARVVSAEEELKTSKLVLNQKEALFAELTNEKAALAEKTETYASTVTDLEAKLHAEALQLSEAAHQIEKLESQVSMLESQLRDQVKTAEEDSAKEIEALKEQVASLSESSSSAFAEHLSKDEVISTLKSKLEGVMSAYKRLKTHVQELQERLTQQISTNDSLKTSYEELKTQHSTSMKELETLQLELASSREQAKPTGDVQAADLGVHDELTQKQGQLEHKETLLADATAREEAARLKTKTDRVRHLEQAGSDREEADKKHEAERVELEAQLCSANTTLEKLRAASDANLAQLENQVTKLKLQVETETEAANAARSALETYKKRAHTALKKASSENKLNLKKAAQNTTKLEQELVSAKGQISALETELEETRQGMAEVEKTGDARAQSAREALETEKRSLEATLRLEIDSLKAEVTRLEQTLENDRIPLEARIKQLTETAEALNNEVISLKEDIRTQSESMEQTVQAKEDEISDLSKQLQATLAAAASLATNEAERRSYSPAISPTEKERRSTASSSRSFDSDRNSFLHQATIDEHMAAAVADSCPIPLASKTNGADQSKSEDEIIRLKLQLNELETKSHLFQKKYEDTSAQLEEANRQKQLQERDEDSTQAINIEYLKNVIMKYIESQVSSEKEQLVPVISTLLNLSPQEHEKVVAAHRPNDEAAGLFGGVFSLFGGAAAAPPPKPLATPHNFRPSPTVSGNTNGAALGSKDKNGVLSFGSDPSDDEEFATPLNPFAA